jgi:hypothetical protein
MTNNRIRLDSGYLVNLEVLDFLVEFWFKEFVAVAFYPFGSVVLIDQISLTSVDFSSLSLCLNLCHCWLPRKILINARREGIFFRVIIKGFLDLDDAPSQPSSPYSSPPSHSPTPIHSIPTFPIPFPLGDDPNLQAITPTNSYLQPLVAAGENRPSDNPSLSPNFLHLTPISSSPHHSPSTLQVIVGDHKDIADYVLQPRFPEKAQLIDPPTPGSVHSVQQSNLLPPTPLLLEPMQLDFIPAPIPESALEPFPEPAPLEPIPGTELFLNLMSDATAEPIPPQQEALAPREDQIDLNGMLPQQDLPHEPADAIEMLQLQHLFHEPEGPR